MVLARHCAVIAQAGEVSASVSCEPSLGVGVAAMLQLAASTPAFSRCNECAYNALQDDLLVEPLEIIDGMIAVPQSPGLGVQVDRTKVEKYQVS
jgi:L-alanine-DL-glutamate epimerase-like enolase superfamily enzyme